MAGPRGQGAGVRPGPGLWIVKLGRAQRGSVRATGHQHPAIGQQRGGVTVPGGQGAGVGPHAGDRIVQLRGGQRARVNPTGHQHIAVVQPGRGVAITVRVHRTRIGPGASGRIVELRRRQCGRRVGAAGHEHLAIGKHRGGLTLPGGGQRGRVRPSAGEGIVQLRGGQRAGADSPGHEHLARGQERGRGISPGGGEGKRGCGHHGQRFKEFRVRQTDAILIQVAGLAGSPRDQHFAVPQQGGRVQLSRHIQVADARPQASGRIVDFRARQEIVAHVHAAGDQHRAIGQQRGGVTGSGRDHRASVRPGAGDGVVEFRGSHRTAARDQDPAAGQHRGRVADSAHRHGSSRSALVKIEIVDGEKLAESCPLRSLPTRREHPAVWQQREGQAGSIPAEIKRFDPLSRKSGKVVLRNIPEISKLTLACPPQSHQVSVRQHDGSMFEAEIIHRRESSPIVADRLIAPDSNGDIAALTPDHGRKISRSAGDDHFSVGH